MSRQWLRLLPRSSALSPAVFKPQDEEPGAASNPRGHGAGRGDDASLRRGVRPGEGAVREVAAYLLDRDHFAGVPPTALVSVQPQPVRSGSYASSVTVQNSDSAGPAADVSQQSDSSASLAGSPSSNEPGLGVKVGSLQQFVHSDGDCEDRGPSAFPVHQARFATIDCVRLRLLMNAPRHGCVPTRQHGPVH